MDDLGRSVGNGISSLIAVAFEGIGSTLRVIVDSANSAVPGGILPVVGFFGLLALAWLLAKR